MRYPALVCICLAGTASTGFAQQFSLTLVPGSITIDTFGGGGSFTAAVYGDADVGTHLLGGALAIESNSDLVTDITWTPASWSAFNTDGGYAGNGNYNQVIFGQLVIPGVPPFDVPAPGSELGGLIGVFPIQTVQFCGVLEFNPVAGSPFALEVIDAITGETWRSGTDNLALNGFQVNVVPAPASTVLLSGAGLLFARRRR